MVSQVVYGCGSLPIVVETLLEYHQLTGMQARVGPVADCAGISHSSHRPNAMAMNITYKSTYIHLTILVESNTQLTHPVKELQDKKQEKTGSYLPS